MKRRCTLYVFGGGDVVNEAVGEMYGAVGECGEVFVVGDDNEGLVHLVAQAEEEFVEFFLVVRIERTGGLVGKDDIGTVDERASHGYALLFASGELCRPVVGAVRESEEVEEFLCFRLGFAFLSAGYKCGNHHVFQSREFGQKLMELKDEAEVLAAELREFCAFEAEHIFAGYLECALVGAVECAHYLQEGGFAGSAGTYYADHFAGCDVEGDAFEHF